MRTVPVADGVLADYDAAGALIGLELTTPSRLTDDALARVDAFLAREGLAGVSREELSPLAAAA